MSSGKPLNPPSTTADHISSRPSTKRARERPTGFKSINVEEDYFSKSAEFRFWLKEEKNKFVDQMDSNKAKSYFSKFARYWNKGKLSPEYYELPTHLRASTASSSHSWSFSGLSALEKEKVQAARQEAFVGPLTSSSSSITQKALIGPTLPPETFSFSTTLGDLQYNRELEEENQQDVLRNKAERKRKRLDEREADRDNRATGKDRLVEKRREKRNGNASYQQEREDRTAVDLDDRSMFGSDSSFQVAIQARDRAEARRTNKNSNFKQEKQIVMQEKLAVMRSKEDSTMSMLKALAASKYGPSA